MTVLTFDKTSSATGGVSVMDKSQVRKNLSGESELKTLTGSAVWTKCLMSEGHGGRSFLCLEDEFSEKLHCGGNGMDSVRIDHPYALTNVNERSDLASLMETCELDADFLKEAVNDKESFQHFLDDVINDYDVPADDIVLGLLDESVGAHRVSAKSPYQPAPSLNSCIFSTAGSTETKLCSSVSSSVPTTTCSSQWLKQAGLFRTTFAAAATTTLTTTTVSLSSRTFIASSSSSSTSTMSSAIEKKSDVEDSRLDKDIDDTAVTVSLSAEDDKFDWSVASSLAPDPADLKATIDDNNNVFAAEQKEICGDCLSVSVSHQISNGVCLLCSAARLMKAKENCSCQGPDYFSSGPLRLGIPDLSPGNPTPAGGKRKSEADDDDDSCPDNDSAWKRARLGVVCREFSEGSSVEFSTAGGSQTGGVLDYDTASSTQDCQERPNPDEEKCTDSKKEHLLDILWLFHPDSLASEDSLPLMTEQRFL